VITMPGNTVASNSEFSEKAPWLAKALLALNLEILEKEKDAGSEKPVWDVGRILNRSTVLAGRAISVWPAP
jgi:hypothetical protein